MLLHERMHKDMTRADVRLCHEDACGGEETQAEQACKISSPSKVCKMIAYQCRVSPSAWGDQAAGDCTCIVRFAIFAANLDLAAPASPLDDAVCSSCLHSRSPAPVACTNVVLVLRRVLVLHMFAGFCRWQHVWLQGDDRQEWKYLDKGNKA